MKNVDELDIDLIDTLKSIKKADTEFESLNTSYSVDTELFLSSIVIELLNIPTQSQIYDYILEKLQLLIKDSYIFIAAYDPDSDSFKVHNMTGMNKKMVSLGEKITGIKAGDFHYPLSILDQETITNLTSGKLHEIEEDGLYFILAKKIPKKVCKILENAFSIDKAYVMGFAWNDEMLGSADILLKKGADFKHKKTVEIFLNIASVVLQRKKAEKELKEREELLSLVTNNMMNVVGQVNNEGIFQYISPSIKPLLGYEVEEVVGESVFEFIKFTHPDDLENVMSTFIAANVSYKPGGVQHRFKSADGNYIWVESLGNPLFNENEQYQGVVFSMMDINSLKIAEEQLKLSLDEKELILRELHHRVKNNMQIISSLLNLQSQYLRDEQDKKIFQSSQDRVKSMAIIHEKLYYSPDLTHIDINEYVNRLVEELYATYKVSKDLIEFKINVEDIFLDMETSIPLGLLINELVSNSLKYAFTEKESGEIRIELKKEGKEYILMVSDNGVGMPVDIDFKKSSTLGLQLIEKLSDQIDGDLEIDTAEGTSFKIKFLEQQYEERLN